MLLFSIVGLGCLNSNENSQNIQATSTPTQTIQLINPTPTIKKINVHASQIILNENDIKDILGQEWVASPNSGKNFYSYDPKSYVNTQYHGPIIKYPRGGAIENLIMIEVLVYDNINNPKLEYERLTSMKKYAGYLSDLKVGDTGKIFTSDERIEIYFIKNNVLCHLYFGKSIYYPDLLSETEKNQMVSIEQTYNLAKKQENKITETLDLLN